VKRLLRFTTLLGVAVFATACAGPGGAARPDAPFRMIAGYKAGVIPPLGLIYSHVKAPLGATPTTLGPKTGRSTVHEIGLPPLPLPGLYTGINLVSWGDASEKAATADGGISQIDQLDYEFESYFWIYKKFTTEVTGR
jgi:hypothetical protein